MDDDDEDNDATTGSVSGNKTHFAELERIESQFPVWLIYQSINHFINQNIS
jgi:hypothetical protein